MFGYACYLNSYVPGAHHCIPRKPEPSIWEGSSDKPVQATGQGTLSIQFHLIYNLAKLLLLTAVFRFTRLPSRYLLGSLGIQTQVYIFGAKLFAKIPFKRGFICRKELGDQCPQI